MLDTIGLNVNLPLLCLVANIFRRNMLFGLLVSFEASIVLDRYLQLASASKVLSSTIQVQDLQQISFDDILNYYLVGPL